MELYINPKIITCFYYILEETKDGHRVSWLFEKDNALQIGSEEVLRNNPLPVFVVERFPQHVINQRDSILKQFRERV